MKNKVFFAHDMRFLEIEQITEFLNSNPERTLKMSYRINKNHSFCKYLVIMENSFLSFTSFYNLWFEDVQIHKSIEGLEQSLNKKLPKIRKLLEKEIPKFYKAQDKLIDKSFIVIGNILC